MGESFTPGDRAVQLRPTAINLGYTVTSDDCEAISLYVEDPKLGDFTILVAPESVPLIAEQLTQLATDLPQYRREWAEKYGAA